MSYVTPENFAMEIPTVIGNLTGGLTFVGAMIYGIYYLPTPVDDVRAAVTAIALTGVVPAE